MGNRLKKAVIICVFLLGLAIFCYPYAQGLLVRREMESTVQTFQTQKETQPTTSVVISDSTPPSEQRQYCGDSIQTGGEKNRSVIGTYFCNNRKNHGAHACSNSNIHQEPLEELVLRKIEEIVFDESRIPGIVQAYRELCQQEDGEDKDKVRTLRQNLKTVEQKISNIVNIIANTGSAALVTQLTQLEREKELLDVQLQEEERGTKEDDLDEDAIRAAFRQAQKMFHSGTLPQMEQIINLYLDKVLVYVEDCKRA